MKILFLDIDGVLAPFSNSYKFVCQNILPDGCLMFEPSCVAELNYICEATKASIVITSSWRFHIKDLELMRAIFREQGVNAPIIGMTPQLTTTRGDEIKSFLELTDGSPYVIVDDADMGFVGLEDRWVQPDCKIGLTAKDSRKIIQLLGENYERRS
jgi:hypothetical protein